MERKRENFRPRLLRVVDIPDFVFRGASRDFPAARVGKLQQKEGECNVRPTYCFRPKDAQVESATYPVRVEVYDLGRGKLHGRAQPLSEAQLTRDELLEVQQIKRTIVFSQGERGLIARDEATGMYILPAADWARVTGKEPKAGETYVVLLEEYPNKFIANPLKPGIGEEEVRTQAMVVAQRSGMITLFHQTHVVSADGLRWVHFKDALWLEKPEFTEKDVQREFHNRSAGAHPDKKAATGGTFAETRQKLAAAKMGCLTAARDLALAWLKGCPATFKSGKQKGQRCGKQRAQGSGYCPKHSVSQSEPDADDGAPEEVEPVKRPAPDPKPARTNGLKLVGVDALQVAAQKDWKVTGDFTVEEYLSELRAKNPAEFAQVAEEARKRGGKLAEALAEVVEAADSAPASQ